MNELITYTVYHTETDKVVATGLSEIELLGLIERMIHEEVVTGIFLPAYTEHSIVSDTKIDVDVLIREIESQGVFYFRYIRDIGSDVDKL